MTDSVRIDKWLWAARFFKTRSLCKAALEGGKIHSDHQRIKPSKMVRVGEMYVIRQGFDEKTIEVLSLSEQRGTATDAQKLYRETEDSLRLREQRKLERQLQPSFAPTGKPDKKQRRNLIQFKKSHPKIP